MPPHHNANFQPGPKVDIKVKLDCRSVTEAVFSPTNHEDLGWKDGEAIARLRKITAKSSYSLTVILLRSYLIVHYNETLTARVQIQV